MLKKWIYIFTAICLLNTLFCFHVGDLFAGGDGTLRLEDGYSYVGSGSLLDFIIQQTQDEDQDSDGQTPLKLKCRHGHFFSRFFSLSIQVPMQAAYNTLFNPGRAPVQYGNYQVRKATLPSYYNFLFRLNLF
ncbi:MAG: hypothetical protein J0H74_27150 [Chitinophagaceae bacterium]|nr:hypothetical protein [Chitinophagaceae bacterium]